MYHRYKDDIVSICMIKYESWYHFNFTILDLVLITKSSDHIINSSYHRNVLATISIILTKEIILSKYKQFLSQKCSDHNFNNL